MIASSCMRWVRSASILAHSGNGRSLHTLIIPRQPCRRKLAGLSGRLPQVRGNRSKYAQPPSLAPAAPRVNSLARYGSGPIGRFLVMLRSLIAHAARPIRFWLYSYSRGGRESLATLDRLRNSQTGQTGVIVCNGPSITRTDLSLIGDHPYILMNRGYLLAENFDGPAVATCSHDPAILEQFGHEIGQTESVLVTTVSARRQVMRATNTAYLMPTAKWRFATHLGLNSHHGATVTFWALELAYLLGWTKTIIIGLDHRYASQAGKQGEVLIAGDSETDHFTPNYLPKGTKFLVNDLALSEYSFSLARAAFEAAGRDVVDCTVGGHCKVFRKGDLATELAEDRSRKSPAGGRACGGSHVE